MTLFETETMAELCAKQGQMADALAIYRRLVTSAPDAATRARRLARLAELEAPTNAPTITMAAVTSAPWLVLERRGDALTFRFSLPNDTEAPTLQVLVLRRGDAGVEREVRTVRLDGPRGAMTLEAPRLISVRAAAGRLEGTRFVPIARLPDEPRTL
ncbi:MAG: hypothetical protein JWM82_3167 [Myxococcales bacterium]|nr:hypothetical protein [Myxococcales bacterium]